MKFRKFVAGAVSAFMLSTCTVGTLGVSAEEVTSVTVDGITYSLRDINADGVNDISEVASYVPEDLANIKEVTILSEVEGLPTKQVAYTALSGILGVEKIVLPETVDNIAYNAFTSSVDLVEVALPTNLKEIPTSCFYSCASLTTVNIPEDLETIGSSAFGRTALTSVTIPDSVTSMGDKAFTACPNLTSVDFGTGVSEIPKRAFKDCTALEEVVIPETITGVKAEAFAGCSSLKELTILNKNCELDATLTDTADVLPELTIKGYLGSTAETFATENGYKFIALDEVPATTEPATTTTVTTTTGITTSTSVSGDTTENKNKIDWTRVLYGDVDLDGSVSISDVVVFSKFNVSISAFPLANATALENADCCYDDELNSIDINTLIEYNIGTLDLEDLGNPDKTGLIQYAK